MGKAAPAILAIAMWSAGCTSGTGPELPADRFALTEVGGDPLPTRVGDESWLADTIRFAVGGAWSRVEVVLLHGEGAQEGPVRRESDGFVTRRGDKIVLDFECGPLAQCLAPDTLRISGEGLVRHRNRYGEEEGDPEFRYDPIGIPF